MIVSFDLENFRALNPRFSKVSDEELHHFFEIAAEIVGNDETSQIPYDPPKVKTRQTLIELLVCHQAELSLWEPGQTGPIGSASQGSVSVSFSSTPSGSSWYEQTRCGKTFLFMMRPYILGGIIVTPKNFHPYG